MKLNKLILVAIVIASLVVISGSANNRSEKAHLKKGLVAYWSFDEGEGDIVFDESGNHHDVGLVCFGEPCSPPEWVKGKIGFALTFDGVDDYVVVPNNRDLDMDKDDFTITAWIKMPSAQGRGDFVTKQKWGREYGYRVFISYAGKLRAAIDNGEQQLMTSNDGLSVDDSQWHFVVASFDRDGNLTRYVDGSLNGTLLDISTFSSIELTNNLDLTIGGSVKDWLFRGTLDEIRIYNRLLTDQEVGKLYKQEPS